MSSDQSMVKKKAAHQSLRQFLVPRSFQTSKDAQQGCTTQRTPTCVPADAHSLSNASPGNMFPLTCPLESVAHHFDSDTSSSSSVSVSPPGMFYVPQGVAPPAQAPLRRGAVLRRFPHLDTRVYRIGVPWTSAAMP